MFESTLEAQTLHEGERRFGTLSAAALAHVAFGLSIVAVTALIVPPIRPPDIPQVVAIIPGIPSAEPTPPSTPPAPPKKGPDEPRRDAVVPPPRATPEVPPVTTPDRPPEPPLDAALPGWIAVETGRPATPTVPAGVRRHGRRSAGGGRAASPVRGRHRRHGASGPAREGRAGVPTVGAPRRFEWARDARAVIAEDRSVESVEVFASSNSLFDEAAVKAVRQWRYRLR